MATPISITNATSSGSVSGVNPLSVPLPAATPTGEETWMCISGQATGADTITTDLVAAGWTLVAHPHDISGGPALYLYCRPSDPSLAGTNVSVTTSNGTRNWHYRSWQTPGVRLSQPWANELDGVFNSAGTDVLTGSMNMFGSNPSGTKLLMIVAQQGGTAFTFSTEVANGFTSPTLTEVIDTQGFMLSLITAPTSTPTVTGEWTQSSTSVHSAWVILDLVENTLVQSVKLYTQQAVRRAANF